jgi:hypothetical protein
MIHNSDATYNIAKGVGGKMSGSQGIYGGYAGPRSWVISVKDTDVYARIANNEELPQDAGALMDVGQCLNGTITNHGANMSVNQCKAGDVLIQIASGSGGFGDPLERDPELVLADFREGRISVDMAKRAYGVSLAAATLTIDLARTEDLRKQRKQERLRQGKPGQEYLRELVEQRNKRALPKPALDFLDEITGFSPAFRDQLEREKELAARGFSPLVKVGVKKEIMDLTPYVKIVEDEQGKKVAVCSRCGFAYCEAREDYKLYCLIHERDPAEIYPAQLAPDKDWAIYREFYCPGCGAQIEAEQCPQGMTIIQEIRINDLG